MTLATMTTLLGGLGLFLLGMSLMTEGLKLAAGPALHRILGLATRTRAHALGSGLLVTALVQSSSAVTVAVIGFVNAGLLTLGPALWVLFGANVGTTMTGWIVALIGLKFKIEALAMPLLGLGAFMRLLGQGRWSAMGTALAGFGLLFMGIALLQQAFAGMVQHICLPQGDGLLSLLAQLGMGLLMTVLMQSSSAAMAITLTAADGGLIGAQGAAAVIIGANIGTTVTALLAVVGATPNARRTALAHVVFNAVTAAVALLLLPWLVQGIGHAQQALSLPADKATQLALFHTLFNLLGVLLMWPIALPLTLWLQQRFRAREEDEAQPQYLDVNVQAVPTLALDALARELGRLQCFIQRLLQRSLAGHDAAALQPDMRLVSALEAAIEDFVEQLRGAPLTPAASTRLSGLLRALRHQTAAAEQALWGAQPEQLAAPLPPALQQHHQSFASAAQDLLAAETHTTRLTSGAASEPFDQCYEALKTALIDAGAQASIELRTMEQGLRTSSALHRGVQQWVLARQRLAEDQAQA